MDKQKEYEALVTQALEAQWMRDEGAAGMAAQIEELVEKRLGEMVYWIGEVMTPGLAAPCTKVKPKLDPMTGQPVEPGGRKPPPTPTEWLDITACDGGFLVAWNSARYLLTTEQARRMVETLSSLLADLPKKEATK